MDHDIIVAPATASGGAIAIVRISGEGAIELCDKVFKGKQTLIGAAGYSVHYGEIRDGERTVDDVLATVFRAPHSYTGEDAIEISCHGSSYIVSEILRLLIAAGARMATAGEFTIRAYLAGKMDLSQAEAVADMIAASTRAEHTMASTQMRGGYSSELEQLRDKLLHLTALLELELDFSEEDVEFADRTQLRSTMEQIELEINRLRSSFSLGNALKEGVAVAIVGAPNVGKSTLLNQLLNEDRVLVSEIAGTTRDVIEECVNIDGVRFRFLDTAGIRSTEDRLEQMGIDRTLKSIALARIIIRMIDAENWNGQTIPPAEFSTTGEQHQILVINKIDKLKPGITIPTKIVGISARQGIGIERLRSTLRTTIDTQALDHGDPIISTMRHFEALTAAQTALHNALAGLSTHLPTDLLSEEIRTVIHHLGTITGTEITSSEVLQTIFSRFCIGK